MRQSIDTCHWSNPAVTHIFPPPLSFPASSGRIREGRRNRPNGRKRIFLMAEGSPFPLSAATPRISVVVPARNEAGNIAPLVEEIVQALAALTPNEIIYVNDGSRDDTEAELKPLIKIHRRLRHISHDASFA